MAMTLSQGLQNFGSPAEAETETEAGARATAAGQSQLAWLATAMRGQYADPHRFLLVFRYAVINLVGFALLAAAYVHGYVDQVIAADQTRLVLVIGFAFLVGFVICTWKVAQTSHELNQVKSFDPLVRSRAAAYLAQVRGRTADSRTLAAAALRLKLSHRIAIVQHFASSLVFMGLIGTVIGFIIALSGVDPAHVSDVEAISPMVANLIEGISVALYTTLVGAVLHLWLMVNYRILASGTVNLITEMVELGETHAGT
ncbi:MAG: MotA/TolQ/ExbB proton channel family protein [Alphaproteobacteria bacterium]|nr:MotA/TolQ/ExbB proton channel family protein [Alphaproteobacteria bacterium]